MRSGCRVGIPMLILITFRIEMSCCHAQLFPSLRLTEIDASLDLKKNIENLENNGITNLRSMVNLGSEVYMQAEV